MVKKPTNPNAKGKGKGAASSSAPPPPPKTTPGSVKPKKMFKKKKAKADPEKQKAAAAEAAATAAASASAPALVPAPAPADVGPSAAVVVAASNGVDRKVVAENNGAGRKEVAENDGADGKVVAENDGADRKMVDENDGADRKNGRKERMKGKEEERLKWEGKGRMKGKGKEKKEDGAEGEERSGAGFIFMCSAKTKPECFQNSVFGLPKGKIDVVEKIRPGAKLFLYDFDLKLMYGVYKATARGGMDLVRRAFHGRFPAQVKFKIDKDCLPLPESSFKHAIKENYNSKGKFTQELSSRQVRRLLELYKPVSLHQSSSQHVEERRQAHQFEGRMPHYVEERRQPYDYEERRLPRHEEMRPTYDYEERRPSHHVEEIRRPRFVEEVHAPTHLPEFHYAPPTYYHHVALASNDLYHPHQAGIIYERASGDTSRDPLPARDHRGLPAEIAARSDHVDELYRSYKLVTRPEGLHQDPYVTTAYENPRPAYPESIQRPVSTRVPVSSLYSFAGAPAYR